MGGNNSKKVDEVEEVEKIIEICKKLATELIITDPPNITEGQKRLVAVAKTTAPDDNNKQIAIITTYLLNISSWENIGVFNSLPAEKTDDTFKSTTFIIPKGTIIWKSSDKHAKDFKFENVDGGIWGSSLDMAYSFISSAKTSGNNLMNLAAFVLPQDIRLFQIENKKSVLALMKMIGDKNIISTLSLISGYGEEWFVGLRQIKAQIVEDANILKSLFRLMNSTPRKWIGTRFSIQSEENKVLTFIGDNPRLEIHGWLEEAGILSEAEIAITQKVFIGAEKYEIGVEPARQFLRNRSHFGFDYSFVQTLKTKLRRRLPEYMIFLAAVAATQAWWLHKSNQMYKEIHNSWEKRRELCDSSTASGVPTPAFLRATLIASKYMVPASVIFDPDSGEVRNMEAICSKKFDRLSQTELIKVGFMLLMTAIAANLNPFGFIALRSLAKDPWSTIQERAKKVPIALKDLTKFQTAVLSNVFGTEYETELLAMSVPALRSIVMKKVPAIRAIAFIDANSGELVTEQAAIITKLFS